MSDILVGADIIRPAAASHCFGFPSANSPRTTVLRAFLYNGIPYCKLRNCGNVLFLFRQEKNEKKPTKGRYEPKRPLWKPPPQRHPTAENVPIFGSLQCKNLQHFEL